MRPSMPMDVQAYSSPIHPFYADVVDGLRKKPPEIPSKYLYDDRGSRLFEEICTTDDYYLARAELELLAEYGADLAAQLGSRPRLVELGAGSGQKTNCLLDFCHDVAAYVPVDMSVDSLRRCVRTMERQFPELRVEPICADYTGAWQVPKIGFEGRTVFFFPGSTIGNFKVPQAQQFLRRLATIAGPNSTLIVGVDLRKDRQILETAYDDEDGVTAAFNRNLLHRINRECNASFDPQSFAHRAIYDEEMSRIEMRLVSRRDQTVAFPSEVFFFQEGDHIVTEYCHKYTIDGFISLTERSGWRTRSVWTDNQQWYSLWMLESS